MTAADNVCISEVKREKECEWLIDSGCSNHMTKKKEGFVSKNEGVNAVVRIGNGEVLPVTWKGSVKLETRVGSTILDEVYFIPELDQNLISVGQLLERGYKVYFEDGMCRIFNEQSELVHKVPMVNKIFKLKMQEVEGAFATLSLTEVTQLWHQRYGHANLDYVIEMQKKGLVLGIPPLSSKLKSVCEACAKGKSHVLPYPSSDWRATERLQLVHTDVCGPMKTTSAGGSKYYVEFIDDATRYSWIYFMKTKDQVFGLFKMWKAEAESQCGHKVRCLRSDRGGEYVSNELKKYLENEGIYHQFSVAYSPQQNGVSERKNRSIMEMARSMMIGMNVPRKFWTEACYTAVYIQNRLKTRALDGKTPFDVWFGVKPKVQHLRVFGCIAYVHIPEARRTKLDEKAIKGVMMGYSGESKGYRIYNPETEKMLITRDVKFDENEAWKWDELIDDRSGTVGIEFPLADPNEGELARENADDDHNLGDDGTQEETPHTDASNNSDSNGSQEENVSSPESGGSSSSNSAHKTRDLASIYRETNPIFDFRYREAEDEEHDEALIMIESALVVGAEPKTFKQAFKHEVWRRAMDEEIKAIEDNGTWVLVDLPSAETKVVDSKWIFKEKLNPDGTINKHKARLVVRGYKQEYGIDYTETYAPVARLDTVRMLLALAANNGWKVHQMDVKSAFLNGMLDEDVYLKQPDGYVKDGEEQKVYKLVKALYGLKQAPRAWYSRINKYLVQNGFERSKSEATLYVKTYTEGKLICSLYVDDLMIIGTEDNLVSEFKDSMQSEFQMTDLGEMRYFLGLEIQQRVDGIFIHQRKYAEELLDKFGLKDSSGMTTPMEHQLKLEATKPGENFDETYYRSIIGSLMYLSASRPDIACAVNMLAAFNHNPSRYHALYARRVLRYVKHSVDHGIWYGRRKNVELYVFSDASYAGNEDCKSRSGYCCSLGTGVFAWSSRKQKVVAQSTAEAEYVAVNMAAKQTQWMKKILMDVDELKGKCVTIYCDSSAAIAMAENPSDHMRTKHMRVKYHYVRELIEEKEIKLAFCRSNFQLADVFTKALPRWKFDSFKKMIGVQAPQDKGGAVEMTCLGQPDVLKMAEELAMAMKTRKKKKLKRKPIEFKCKWRLELMILSIIQQCMDQGNEVEDQKNENAD